MKHIKRYTQLFESVQELSQEQQDWLDKCSKGSWNLNPKTGLVDVKGDFDCGGQGLDSFKGVRFGTVSGIFSCYKNRLTSLEGGPQSVGMHFGCSNNPLTSLKGAPQSVDGNFYCEDTSLTSLEGAPRKVGGHVHCTGNPISERAIMDVLKRMSGKEISLEQAVKGFWRYIPEEDRLYLAKHNPNLSPEDKRGYEALLKFRGKII